MSTQPEVSEAPTTPIRGRQTARYPAALSKREPGRVPLHRRGPSRTLECLEDLLRENGYKETRVFTPESERFDTRTGEHDRQPTWRFRELLSGWLPGATASEPASDNEDTPAPRKSRRPVTPTRPSAYHSTPNSPLNKKRPLGRESTHPIASPNSASSTTLSSMRTSTTTDSRAVSYQPTRRQIHDRIPAIRAELTAANLRTYAQVSAAQGYLRHMASTPNMAKRPVPSTRDSSVDREPPLPASWLESVTKAMLRSGDGASHIGGPISRPSSRLSLRTPRASKENRFSAAERTPKPSHTSGRSASGMAPGASLYLSRAQTAPSAVNTAHVMCRSAPGSRSASRAGDRSMGGDSARRKDRLERGRRGARGDPADRVPSLAATRIEDDALAKLGSYWIDGRRVSLSLSHPSHVDDGVDSDDDEEGELDLARLLVPPKRQYSIQSLRKHLHVAQRQNLAGRSGGTSLLSIDGWEDDDAPRRGHGHQIVIDDSDGYPTFQRSDSMKRRRGLPGAWGAAGSSRS